MKSIIQTKHNLDFEVTESKLGMLYRIGTVTGQWGSTWDSYYILSFLNHKQGNGHLDDVFEWFEYSCKRDCRNLLVLECMNERFATHLMNKRGFFSLDPEGLNYIKVFNKTYYKKLRRKGNEILMPITLKCK